MASGYGAEQGSASAKKDETTLAKPRVGRLGPLAAVVEEPPADAIGSPIRTDAVRYDRGERCRYSGRRARPRRAPRQRREPFLGLGAGGHARDATCHANEPPTATMEADAHTYPRSALSGTGYDRNGRIGRHGCCHGAGRKRGYDHHVTSAEIIQEIGVRLARVAPRDSRVVLFGSHARGEADEGSDYDILVIEPEVVDAARESVRLRTELGDLLVPIDVIVIDRERARRRGPCPRHYGRARVARGPGSCRHLIRSNETMSSGSMLSRRSRITESGAGRSRFRDTADA